MYLITNLKNSNEYTENKNKIIDTRAFNVNNTRTTYIHISICRHNCIVVITIEIINTQYYYTHQHRDIRHHDGVVFGTDALVRVEPVHFLLVVRESAIIVER